MFVMSLPIDVFQEQKEDTSSSFQRKTNWRQRHVSMPNRITSRASSSSKLPKENLHCTEMPSKSSKYFQKSGDFLTVFCFGFSRKNLAWGQKCDIFVKGNVETSATLNDLIIFRGHMTLNQTLTSSSREDTKGQKVANLSCQVALPIAEISCPQNPTRSRKNYLFWCTYASTILVIIESSDVEWFWNPDMSSINFIRNTKLDWLVGIGHVLWLCRNFLVSKVPSFVKSIPFYDGNCINSKNELIL